VTLPPEARFAVEVFVTLFVIVDPVGTVPLFLSLTSGRTRQVRRRLATQAVLVSFVVITSFAVFGQSILRYLGITLPSLQAAGGLLLLLVALQLLTGSADEPTETRNVNVAMVPLGTPLLAGPGAIAATIVFVQRLHTWVDAAALAAGIVAVHLVLWATMRYSVGLIRVLRDSGVMLITRISGLLLAAIAVQLTADAVRAFISGAA
jgi:multiple antibiotic resistance protein